MDGFKLISSQLVAHRGHQHYFPENSLLSILDAIAAGAKNIEFDIQLTSDGYPVLYHDDDMLRLSDVNKKITQLSKADLTGIYVKEAKRLGKRFNENPIDGLVDLLPFIKRHGDIQFFLELKQESINAHGENLCFEGMKNIFFQIPENIVFISFNLSAVKRAKNEGFSKTALVFRDWENRDALLKEANADIGFINYKRIPLDEDIRATKPIMVYEVTHANVAKQLIQRGAAAVETFHIRTLLENV